MLLKYMMIIENKKGELKMEERKVVSITLPINLIEEIKQIASDSKRTFSSQIEMLIEMTLRDMHDEEVK